MNVGIVGATGYSGIELIRFLIQHPHARLQTIITTSQFGKELSEIYPHLTNIIDMKLEAWDVDLVSSNIDLVFFATPSGISKNFVPALIDKGIKCIDLSGDFRLQDKNLYELWYKHTAAPMDYLNQAVYGLSEIYYESIKNASLIANPGCYPTATLLALAPLMKNKWIDPQSIVIDGKSGVSGAGRSISLASHYAEVNENVKAYKLSGHQHIPEIERILNTYDYEENINITFSTHLIPMTRGIMCTVYTKLSEWKSTKEVIDLYQQFYENDPFIRIRPEGSWPSTKEVYGSNYCDLGFMSDPRTGRLTIISVIDNVVKGAAGQAIQNMNLLFGWDHKSGLTSTPIYP